MSEDLQKRCEHLQVRLTHPNYTGDHYGSGKCLECNRKIIIFPSDYELIKKEIYEKIKQKTTQPPFQF